MLSGKEIRRIRAYLYSILNWIWEVPVIPAKAGILFPKWIPGLRPEWQSIVICNWTHYNGTLESPLCSYFCLFSSDSSFLYSGKPFAISLFWESSFYIGSDDILCWRCKYGCWDNLCLLNRSPDRTTRITNSCRCFWGKWSLRVFDFRWYYSFSYASFSSNSHHGFGITSLSWI